MLALPAAASSQSLLYTIPNAGYWVADGVDVNGDGRGDLLIGDPLLNVGGAQLTGKGRVYSGRTGALLYTINAPAPGVEMGWATSGLGDVNGDGKSEFLFGSRFSSPNGLFQAGEVRVFDGASGAVLQVLEGTSYDGRFGHNLHGGGELNGDGIPDFLVGDVTASPYGPGPAAGCGRVVGYSGADFSILVDLPGEPVGGDWFGNDVAFVGDLDGDGLDEFAAAAPQHASNLGPASHAGRAYVYSPVGPTLLATFDGSAPEEFLGYTMAPGGHVDADAVPDFLIGVPFANNGAAVDVGKLIAVSGADFSTIATYWGENAGDQFAYGLDGGADVDGDGRSDILAGAIGYDAGSLTNAGRAYLISGRTGAILHAPTGVFSGGNYGRRVAMLGRVNCGVVPDYAIGGTHTHVYTLAEDCEGPGCPGTPGYPASIGMKGRAVLGSAFSITAKAGGPFQPGLVLLGFSDQSSPGGPLPLELSALGLSGCYLRVSPDLGFFRLADAAGILRADFLLSQDPGLVGLALFTQWIVFDPGSANGQFAPSDAGEIVLREP